MGAMTDTETIIAAIAAAIALGAICVCWILAARRARFYKEYRRKSVSPVNPISAPAAFVPKPAPWAAPPPVPRAPVSSFTASPTPSPRRRDDDDSSSLFAMSMLNSGSPSSSMGLVSSDPESGGGGDYGGGGASSSWDSGSSCSSDSSSSSSYSGSCSSD